MVETIIVLSIGLNVFQMIFWSRQNQKLVDKLMSRNYAEYAHYQKPIEKELQKEKEIDDNEVLEEINRLLPS